VGSVGVEEELLTADEADRRSRPIFSLIAGRPADRGRPPPPSMLRNNYTEPLFTNEKTSVSCS
jgi:hypothetical protein